jgi:hypothetical protein
MKHFAKLMLLTFFPVALLSLPCHAAPAPNGPPSSLTLVYGTSGCTNSFVAILPSGNQIPASGCYVVPAGWNLVVTDITVIFEGCPAPGAEAIFALLNAGAGPDVYRASRQVQADGAASCQADFTTGIAFSANAVIRNTAGPLACTGFGLQLQSYLTNAMQAQGQQ